MKRFSEVVLNGHPDKFCDLLADRIIQEIYRSDPNAYAQIEVSVWSDIIFLTGGVVTGKPLKFSLVDLINKLGKEIGYTANNHIDIEKYIIKDHICWLTGQSADWTNHVNDQSIIVGYAGYDHLTHYLPPEHYFAWYIREKIILSLSHGALQGQGPDGKILVILNEENGEWKIKKLLITLQQHKDSNFCDLAEKIEAESKTAYKQLQKRDARWISKWDDIQLLINPNGPFVQGGSDGDNGQTGRKLVMDYYGPRIPIGGGAFYGKDLTHIDRLAAMTARKCALEMVKAGAKESIIKLCYAPGESTPLHIEIASDIKPMADIRSKFNFKEMKRSMDIRDINYSSLQLGSFYNDTLSFNK